MRDHHHHHSVVVDSLQCGSKWPGIAESSGATELYQ